MKFIFWQNVISIHQSAFIKALSRDHDVVLVAQEELTNQRKADGWNIPEMGNATILIAPNEDKIIDLLSVKDAKQVFSGIDAYPMVYNAFKKAISMGCDISVMMEPYQWQGFKGFFRRCKYSIHALRFGNSINHIFATGDLGVKVFRKAGFPHSKLHHWGYFTEQSIQNNLNENNTPKIIFVGSIDKRKNILSLVEVANKHKDLYEDFFIIGGGPLEKELQNAIKDNDKIHFLGRLKNEAVASIIASCDLLVLPSLFDGWGAVINEALSQGTRVLCSENCGASSLLDGNIRGGIFSLHNQDSLSHEFVRWLNKGVITPDQRKEISDWAKHNISGESAADYFISTLHLHSSDTVHFTPSPTKKM